MMGDSLSSTTPTNPLMIPLVLQNVIDHCSIEDLPAVRKVCGVWRDVALTRWRKDKLLMVFAKKTAGGQGRNLENKWEGASMDELRIKRGDKFGIAELMNKPFRNYRVNCVYGVDLGIKSVQSFWRNFGRKMNCLQLVQVDCYSDVAIISKLKDILFNKTPNLKCLSLCFGDHFSSSGNSSAPSSSSSSSAPTQEDGKSDVRLLEVKVGNKSKDVRFPLEWAEVFEGFPQLESIRLGMTHVGVDRTFDFGLDNLLTTYDTICQEKTKDGNAWERKWKNLKHLDILDINPVEISVFPEAILEQLRSLQLPLESLKLDLGTATHHSQLKELLQIHSKSLRTLHAFRGISAIPYSAFPFGVDFHSLAELKLYGTVVKNLGFLAHTPQLRTLHMFQLGHGFKLKFLRLQKNDFVIRAMDSLRVHLPKMEELKGDFSFESSRTFQSFPGWMPNLKRLEMKLDANLFRIVSQGIWRQTLEELCLLPGTALDDHLLHATQGNFERLRKLEIMKKNNKK